MADTLRVRVYRNLHNGKLSVQARIPGKGWRVVAHAAAIRLANVTFEVSETARQRVLRTGRKEVHAFAVGDLLAWAGESYAMGWDTAVYSDALDDAAVGDPEDLPPLPRAAMARVAYNPRRQGEFHWVTGSPDREPPVYRAALLHLQADGLMFATALS